MFKSTVFPVAFILSCGHASAQPAQYSCPPSLEGHALLNWDMKDTAGGRLISAGSQSDPVWKLTAAQANSGTAQIVCGYRGTPRTVAFLVRRGLTQCVNPEMTSQFECTSTEALAKTNGNAALPASAPGRKMTYKGQGMTFQILERGDGTVDVSGEVLGGGGCMGSFSGTGRVNGNKISAAARDTPACKIDIVRTTKGITTTENDGCEFMHGARCNFTGAAAQAR